MTTHWPRPDFLAPRRRTPVLAWVWAATGALVLAVSVTEAVVVQQAVTAQRAQLAKATQHLAKVTPARPNSSLANRASVDSSGDADAIRAAQRVLAQLGHPWGQILATVEAETPSGLQWLLLDHAIDSPDLRFEGLAPDAWIALQMVDALSVRPGWSGVALTRLQAPELRDGVAAMPVAIVPIPVPVQNWRFEIAAVVNAQRIAASPLGAGG